MNDINQKRPALWRIAMWGALATLLSLPAIFRFPWTASDFVIMGIMLGSVGLGIEFLVRRSGSNAFRLGSVAAVLTAFMTVWANLAVGMIGSEDNPYNLFFMAIPVVVFAAAALVRFDARRTAWIMAGAAAVQLALALGGMEVDLRGARFSSFFAVLWLIAAALFWSAAVGERRSVR
jgi:hypothetical protein